MDSCSATASCVKATPPKDLWTHCIATAVAARDITKQMKQPWADEAFTLR